jgi:hypothetical protein
MKSAEQNEKSARGMTALLGSFLAGMLVAWSLGVAGPNTAKSEERFSAPSLRGSQVEQAASAQADDSSQRQVRGHSECSLQLD